MRNLALMWVLAACLLGCGGRDKDAKDKAAVATDTAVAVADTVASAPDTAAAVQSWKSGETTVTLKDGILTVSGKGAMADYGFEWPEPPWAGLSRSVTSVVIEDGVTSIGKMAFPGYILTSVAIGNNVNVIGSGAFAYCKLTSIIIPNSVTVIGAGAFSDCDGLTSITIPNSVMEISEAEFIQCTTLTAINVVANNANYSSEDGVLFNKKKTTLIRYPSGKRGAYTIPPSVTELGKFAFRDCIGLTSLTCLNPVPPRIIVDNETFLFVPACLYVPENSLTAYRDAERWKYDFKCIKAIESAPE